VTLSRDKEDLFHKATRKKRGGKKQETTLCDLSDKDTNEQMNGDGLGDDKPKKTILPVFNLSGYGGKTMCQERLGLR
jgi:hypothetical protein